MASREEYIRNMERRLRLAKERIGNFEDAVDRRMAELKGLKDRMEREYRQAEQRLDGLRTATDENWEGPKREFEKELADMDLMSDNAVKNLERK